MPVDPDPIDLVHCEVDEILVTEDGEVIRITEEVQEKRDDEVGYLSHFSTCPDANKWRGRARNQTKADKQQAALKFFKNKRKTR